MKSLEECVAVVTGASRGGGKGIAIELGAAGATVYVTGRTTRQGAPAAYRGFLERTGIAAIPGTIEDTAEAITEAGGRGIAVACDHSDPGQVRALFERVDKEQKRIDLLVNNAWGGHESFTVASLSAPFWEQPLDHFTSMFDNGVRNHIIACQAAASMFLAQKRGLIVTTTYWDRGHYIKGNLFYDLAKAALCRLAFDVAEELRSYNITSLAVAPGWMRTEIILAGFKADETNWKDHPALSRTESPRYLGRAVVALASDPNVHAKTGTTQLVGNLAHEYGFTDVDGRTIPPFEL